MKNRSPLFGLFQIGNTIHNLNKRSEANIGMSLVQWCLLQQLMDMPGTSAMALAKSIGVHPSTLTQSLKRLEKKGFLFLTADPRDSRKKLVSLTREGLSALANAEPQMKIWAKNVTTLSRQMDDINISISSLF